MGRPRYTAAKRAREQKQKAKREAKLARKHSRTRPVTPDGTESNAAPGDVIVGGGSDAGAPGPAPGSPNSETDSGSPALSELGRAKDSGVS